MKSIILRLSKLSFWSFVFLFTFIAVIISELLVSIQSYFLTGSLFDKNLMIAGFITPAIDGFFMFIAVAYLVKHLKNVQENLIFAEKELQEQKDKFESVFKYSKDGIAILDQTSRFIEFNDAYAGFSGYSRDELLQLHCFELTPEDEREKSREGLEAAFKSGSMVNFEKACIRKDGSLSHINMSLVLMPDKKTMLITAQDVTETKRTTERLREQKEEFEAIFNNSKDGIAIFDLTSKFLAFNDAYLDMTGFERDELLTKSCIELAAPEDKEKSKAVMEKVLHDGFVENFEKSCFVKDDKVITINMTLSLMPDKKRVIVVAKNITQYKLLESQAKLASMGEMIANIAHQWRQPLSVITTSASSIAFKQELNQLEEQEIIDAMDMIVRQGNYLSKTIDDFRYFLKGEKIEENLNLNKLFEKTFSIVGPSLKSNHIQLITNIDQTLEINGYESELMQAIINIINNAKDALLVNDSVKEKCIFIDVKQLDTSCEIIIKDNGGGIKLSAMNRIFEPYYTTKHQSQGTGLGLSMAHRIITEIHNGNISASNSTFEYNDKVYVGASFCINL